MGIRNHRQQTTYFQTVSITRKKYYDRFSSYSSSKLPNHNLFLICYSEVRGFCWPQLSSKESNNLVGYSVGLRYVCWFSVQKVPGSITVEPSLPKSIIKHLRWDPFTGEIVGVSLHPWCNSPLVSPLTNRCGEKDTRQIPAHWSALIPRSPPTAFPESIVFLPYVSM